MTEPETIAFTRRLVAGDEGAYRDFHQQYSGRLFRYLWVVARGDEQSAREALQETLRRVIRHMRVFPDEAVFWSWLTVIARSSLWDEKRRTRRYRGFLDRFRRHAEVAVEADSLRSADAEQRLSDTLAEHLTLLPAEDRELMERKYLQQQSVRKIAESLGVTEKTIESRLSRLRAKLKTELLSRLNHEAKL